MSADLVTRLKNPRNKLARIYDNPDFGDRYTIVYLSHQVADDGSKWFPYRAASANPFHPQGIGLYQESPAAPVDFPCARVGRRNHLGRRIVFDDLPSDVQALVLSDLRD